MSTAAPVITLAPRPFWVEANTFIITLYDLFGGPERIAADGWASRKWYRIMRSWLSVLEALIRRVLLIEASYYFNAAQPARKPASARRKAARTHCSIAHDPDKPEAWRVRMAFFATARARRRRRLRRVRLRLSRLDRRRLAFLKETPPRTGPPALKLPPSLRQTRAQTAPAPLPPAAPSLAHAHYNLTPTWGLAKRFEAALRVYNNPGPHARRLARKLARLSYRTARTILKAPTEAKHRVDNWAMIARGAKRCLKRGLFKRADSS